MSTAFPRSRSPSGNADRRRHQQIVTRLRLVTGQLSGVQGMCEDGRYCIDVLDQLSAVRAATDAVALMLLEDHIRACVREAIRAGDPDASVDELVVAVRRYVHGH